MEKYQYILDVVHSSRAELSGDGSSKDKYDIHAIAAAASL